ncbi:MAG: tRNA (adenosine(37)-N6)-dimethylallyltransferase MiaA [Thermoguttaceae bacterium]|nr:tRNA (adenosine(37)-N6)-dimethylallyltransferase MiaA [Thermoguttaceae bacterium]
MAEATCFLPSDAVFLTGPTASGKSDCGICVARIIHAEILSLDSMAVYRRMDIGTAKPTTGQRALVPHHLIDIVEPSECFSLASYLKAAETAVREIRRRNARPLFVGGTPLYLKGLLRGIFDGPEADQQFRALWQEKEQQSPGTLHARLRQVDPVSAERLHPNDHKRLLRALEVYEVTGQPISSLQTQFSRQPPCGAPLFVLDWPREVLYDRINRRVDAMVAAGLPDEVKSLLAEDKPLSKTASAAVGYRELIAHFSGECSLDEAIEQIKRATRNFAKRQMTWFRSFPEARFIPMNDDSTAENTAEKIAAVLSSSNA